MNKPNFICILLALGGIALFSSTVQSAKIHNLSDTRIIRTFKVPTNSTDFKLKRYLAAISLKVAASPNAFDRLPAFQEWVHIALPIRKPTYTHSTHKPVLGSSLNPNIMNSVALATRLNNMSAKWQRHLRQTRKLILAATRCQDRHCEARSLGLLKKSESMREASFEAKLRFVNNYVNHFVQYQADSKTYGKVDHWASLTEISARKKGDCEDYALTKYTMLTYLGVPQNLMQLVIVKDLRKKRYHAVLAVHADNDVYLLDNNAGYVLRQHQIKHYMPMISFSGNKSWIHGFRTKQQLLSQRATVKGPVIPG